MTDTNSVDKNVLRSLSFFSGHQNFESSVPKGHQNMNVFVGPCVTTDI